MRTSTSPSFVTPRPVQVDADREFEVLERDGLEPDDCRVVANYLPAQPRGPAADVRRLLLDLVLERPPLAGQELVLLADRGDELGRDEPVQLGLDPRRSVSQVVGCVLDQQAGEVVDRPGNVGDLADQVEHLGHPPRQRGGAGDDLLDAAQFATDVGGHLALAGEVVVDLVEADHLAHGRVEVAAAADREGCPE